jgi:cell division transport system permease protein
MRTLLYFIKEAVRGLYQAKLMTVVSIGTIGLSLFCLCLIFAGYLTLQAWIEQAAASVRVVAFITDSTAARPADLARLTSEVRAQRGAGGVVLVDKKNAWERFRGAYGARLLEAVDANPLPASLEIALVNSYRSSDSAQRLMDAVSRLPGIEGVSFSRDQMVKLEVWRRNVGVGGVLVLIVVGLVLNFMIANSIKLTIYARKELVTNMRFVGATDRYIRMPFILEGMLQGFIGALVAVALIAALRAFPLPIEWGGFRLMLLATTSLGVLVGCIGSMSAVRKFLT